MLRAAGLPILPLYSVSRCHPRPPDVNRSFHPVPILVLNCDVDSHYAWYKISIRSVIDLGAGMDVFLAANQVGESGQVLGIDMTQEILDRARANDARGDYPQVAFHQADIERLPFPSDSADVVLNNCVINLAPGKSAVYRELFRVLKPGESLPFRISCWMKSRN